MKTKTLTLTAAAGLLLTACIPSVHPFYTANDVVVEPTLLGEWQTKASEVEPEHWKFEEGEGQSYNLTVRDEDGKQGSFKATLFKLKDQHFMDLIPSDCDYATNQADLVAASMFPGHLLIHVAQVEPGLKLAFCDFDWLEDYLEQEPDALPHHEEEGRILLTASTTQLQRFMLKHLEAGELFDDYGELTKVSGPGQ